jgi:hypothetical protein
MKQVPKLLWGEFVAVKGRRHATEPLTVPFAMKKGSAHVAVQVFQD